MPNKERVGVEELIWLGRQLRQPPSDLLQDVYLVPGCQSSAWLRLNADGTIDGWADAIIARGMVALIANRYDRLESVAGLSLGLSLSRSSGLESMLKTIYNQKIKYTLLPFANSQTNDYPYKHRHRRN